MHISNPNPQFGSKKFTGIRDQGYNSAHASPANATGKAGLSLIHTPSLGHKFGKRVFMGSYQMSDKEVFDMHMQQIKMKGSLQNIERDIKLREEQEFTRFVQDQLRKDREKHAHIQRMINQDFVDVNAVKRHDNEEKKKHDHDVKMKETYQYFPYTGSDEVENKRKELKLA